MVAQHPGGAGALLGSLAEVVVGDMLDASRVPASAEHVEIERLTKFVGARVGRAALGVNPSFGHCHARRVVFVEHLAPRAIDVVNFIAVEQIVGAVVLDEREVISGALGQVAIGQVLHQRMSNVDAIAVNSAVAPKT